MKRCTKCKELKDEAEFSLRKRGDRDSYCRDCHAAYCRDWYEKNKEEHLLYVYEHNPKFKTHKCNYCGRGEPEVRFHRRKVDGKSYPQFICNECKTEYQKKYPTTEAARKRYAVKKNAKTRIARTVKENRAQFILGDSRKSDAKFKRENDLDLEFVKLAIADGCIYCHDKEMQTTLDRIDNSHGHLKTNVVASCVRCNWLRRDMPMAAWKELVPAIRKAAKKGIFGDWHAGPTKSKERAASPDDLAILKAI